MAGSFFDTFNSTLPDMEAQFSETWTHKGIELPAIVIETMDQDEHAIKGGILSNVTVRICVRDEVFNQAGVLLGDFVGARGLEMSVGRIESDGDASKTLICIAKGVDVWK